MALPTDRNVDSIRPCGSKTLRYAPPSAKASRPDEPDATHIPFPCRRVAVAPCGARAPRPRRAPAKHPSHPRRAQQQQRAPPAPHGTHPPSRPPKPAPRRGRPTARRLARGGPAGAFRSGQGARQLLRGWHEPRAPPRRPRRRRTRRRGVRLEDAGGGKRLDALGRAWDPVWGFPRVSWEVIGIIMAHPQRRRPAPYALERVPGCQGVEVDPKCKRRPQLVAPLPPPTHHAWPPRLATTRRPCAARRCLDAKTPRRGTRRGGRLL